MFFSLSTFSEFSILQCVFFVIKRRKIKQKKKYIEENKYIQILTMVSCGGEDVSYVF